MIRTRFFPLLALILILATFLLAACSSADSATSSADPELITLVATDIAFDRSELEVEAGRPVRITLDNQGVLEHDFSIQEIPTSGEIVEDSGETEDHDMGHVTEDPDVHVAAMTGNSHTVEFTPAEAGEYEFYCTVSGHREAGMVGTLIVREP
jgi:uncharacterized cupredoxin-like copper-binding protein